MLLAPDPISPNHLLLSHAKSAPLTALTPTLILQIQSRSDASSIPAITFQGSHTLSASDFLAHRPEALHRRLLISHLLKLIDSATDPIPVSTLYANSPHSSPFQIQRALKDLLNMARSSGPARGFYSPARPNPVFPGQTTLDNEKHLEHLLHSILDTIEDDELRARETAAVLKEIAQ